EVGGAGAPGGGVAWFVPPAAALGGLAGDADPEPAPEGPPAAVEPPRPEGTGTVKVGDGVPVPVGNWPKPPKPVAPWFGSVPVWGGEPGRPLVPAGASFGWVPAQAAPSSDTATMASAARASRRRFVVLITLPVALRRS